MDPLTITATCITLVSTIGKVSFQINTFVRQVRDSRQDLDAVSRELHSLETILNILSDDHDNQERQAALPTNLVAQIAGIMSNCGGVLAQIQASLTKHGGGGLKKGIKWTISGQEDMDKLRSSLEAHKSALGLTLDFATHLVTREIITNTQTIAGDTAVIRGDTLLIRGDTTVIKEDNAQILSEIAKLQARLPVEIQSSNSTGITLQRYLDNLSSYAESSCDAAEVADAWEKINEGTSDSPSRSSRSMTGRKQRKWPNEAVYPVGSDARTSRIASTETSEEPLKPPSGTDNSISGNFKNQLVIIMSERDELATQKVAWEADRVYITNELKTLRKKTERLESELEAVECDHDGKLEIALNRDRARGEEIQKLKVTQAAQIEQLKNDHAQVLRRLQARLDAKDLNLNALEKAYDSLKKEKDLLIAQSPEQTMPVGNPNEPSAKQERLDKAVATGPLMQLDKNQFDVSKHMWDEVESWDTTPIKNKRFGDDIALQSKTKRCGTPSCPGRITFPIRNNSSYCVTCGNHYCWHCRSIVRDLNGRLFHLHRYSCAAGRRFSP